MQILTEADEEHLHFRATWHDFLAALLPEGNRDHLP